MKPAWVWAIVAGTLAATWLALTLGPQWLLVELAAAMLMLRQRATFLAVAVLGLAINVAFFAFLMPGDGWHLGPIALSREGALRGLVGGVRLTTIAAVNLAVLARVPVAALLDGLRLPQGPTAFLAAVLALAHDLGREWGRLVDARRLDGAWPTGIARIKSSASLLPALLVVAVRRAMVRRDALRLAGHDTAPAFAALVAVTSLAAAGRMAMLAIPNDPVTYAVVFLGGVLFGPALGALAGLLAMTTTNLLISGLHPVAFANAPAMALLGLTGGLVGRFRLVHGDGITVRLVSAACGAVGVLLFSLASDVLTWFVVPDYRGHVAVLQTLLAAGLLFNVGPAIAAAVVFALAVGPVARAAEAAGLHGLGATGASRRLRKNREAP